MSRHLPYFLSMSLCCVLAATSCDGESAIQSDWTIGEDGGLSADAPDAMPDTGCPSPPTISPTTISYEPFGLPTFGVDGPIASNGVVYFARRVDDAAAEGSFEIFGLDPASHHETRLTRSAEDDAVFAVANDRLLNATFPPEGLSYFGVLDRDGRLLYESADPYPIIPIRSGSSGAARHAFDGQRLLLRDDERDIHLIDIERGDLGAIDFGERMLDSAPVMSPDGVVFTAALSDLDSTVADVFIFTVEEGLRQLTDTPGYERFPTVDGPDLYWVTDEAVYLRRGGEAPRRIHEGRCNAPHAADGMAVFACATSDDVPDPARYPSTATVLYVYDGDHARPVTGTEHDTYIQSPRVSRWGVAWFEYDDPSALCNQGSRGRLMFHDFAYGQAIEVDTVGAPCLCCGAIWPQLSLHLDDNLIAWNYSTFDGEPRTRGAGYAFAVVERNADCRLME